jgi:predicted phosphodiesterase
MQIAIIADIHGNALALRAVLEDVARRGIREIINLGDCVSGPLWPRESFDLIAASGCRTVRGNHDRWVAAGEGGPSDRVARDALEAAQMAWLGALPMRVEPQPGLLAFHARPDDDQAYLLESVEDGRLVAARSEVVAERLGDTQAALLLCAHSHMPGLLRLPDGRMVLNPGSVGCPAYDDPTAPAHVSESGSPFARYAVLDWSEGTVDGVSLLAIRYDHEAAARQAEALGRPEWGYALRSGSMPPGGRR